MVVSLNKNYRKIKDSMCFLITTLNRKTCYLSLPRLLWTYSCTQPVTNQKGTHYLYPIIVRNLFHWYLLTQFCVAETCVWRLKWMCAENLLKLGVISLCKQWRCLIWYMWTSRMILLAVINRLVLGLISAMSKHLVHKYKVLSTCPQNKTLTIRFGRRNSVPPPPPPPHTVEIPSHRLFLLSIVSYSQLYV